jgi:hypothetical protein
MTSLGKNAQPVFVVGMNGSGTTMLLDNLGRHPGLYAFPRESRLIPYLIASHHRFGDLHQDDNFRLLWEEVLSLNVFSYVNNHVKVPLPENWKEYPRDLAGVLDGVFRYFAAREGKQRWCEKTPQHVQHMDKLAELVPLARFIHVIRDGRDSAASFNRRWYRTPYLTLFRWKKVVAAGHAQGEKLGPDRYMELRYEDLTTDPEAWFRKICSFLAISYDEAVLVSAQPYLKGTAQRKEDAELGRLKPNSGNWKRYFSARQQRRLDRIAGRTLALFGYETACPSSDYDPPGWKRRLWTMKDYLVQYAREIGLKLTGKIERPWRVILSRPFTAYRQRGENRF